MLVRSMTIEVRVAGRGAVKDGEPKSDAEVGAHCDLCDQDVDIVVSVSADASSFDRALALVMADKNVDMVLAIFVAPIMIDAVSVAASFAKHAKARRKPLLACLPGLPESGSPTS